MGQERESTKKSLKLKEFKIRNSPLSDRLESNEDIKTIYNLFFIILLSLLTNTILHDYTHTGQFHFGLRLIIGGFNNFEIALLIWICYNGLCFATFFAFRFWGQVRLQLTPKITRSWDQMSLTFLLLYYFFSLYSLQKLIEVFEFNPGSAALIVLEEVRLLMKQHSFVRTNAPKIFNYKPHTEEEFQMPKITNFVYFLFAPTLLYRDEYPRTSKIRWKFVFVHLGEILGIILLLSLVTERFLVPPFEEICLRKFTTKEILIPVIGNSFPGILYMLSAFYSVLHAAQNAFAELLRFGDRMFYEEWWTAKSLSEYYRKWNVVVHDWLYSYIFKDMYEIVLPRNKWLARLTVFVASAVMHEWIMTTCLGLFLPVQFIQFFLAGAFLTFLNILDVPVGNFVMWYLLIVGAGLQVNLYALEFFARRNCPLTNNSGLEFFMPRFLTCNCIG